MASEDEKRRETAWNLYCAFSTYRDAQEAMQDARAATNSHFYEHARYIANWHNFTNKKMLGALTSRGIDVLISAIAYEIERGLPPPNSSRDELGDEFAPRFDNDDWVPIGFRNTPLGGGGVCPQIIISPVAYTDGDAMATFLEKHLPRVRERVLKERAEKIDEYSGDSRKLRGKFTDKLSELSERLAGVPEPPQVVVRTDVADFPEPPQLIAEADVRASLKEHCRRHGFSAEDAKLVAENFRYWPDGSPVIKQGDDGPYIDYSGPVGWHPTTLLPRSGESFDTYNRARAHREREKQELPTHARWWAALCGPPGKATDRFVHTMADVAREYGVKDASAIRREIPEMERNHGLGEKCSASRKKKRDT